MVEVHFKLAELLWEGVQNMKYMCLLQFGIVLWDQLVLGFAAEELLLSEQIEDGWPCIGLASVGLG